MADLQSSIEKNGSMHIDEANGDEGKWEEPIVREFDPKFVRKTMRKVRCYCHTVRTRADPVPAGPDRYASPDSYLPDLFT